MLDITLGAQVTAEEEDRARLLLGSLAARAGGVGVEKLRRPAADMALGGALRAFLREAGAEASQATGESVVRCLRQLLASVENGAGL